MDDKSERIVSDKSRRKLEYLQSWLEGVAMHFDFAAPPWGNEMASNEQFDKEWPEIAREVQERARRADERILAAMEGNEMTRNEWENTRPWLEFECPDGHRERLRYCGPNTVPMWEVPGADEVLPSVAEEFDKYLFPILEMASRGEW